jgi:predicted mannosyl-3-phosphoglycerate phosphatase (HAD superfamily)
MKKIEFENSILHKADNDIEWSREVKEKNNYKCILCGSKSEAAHIFRRGNKNTRLITENGVNLCNRHHSTFDKASPKEHRRYAILFVGALLYGVLEHLSKVRKEYVNLWN